jgi:hypothetical protein
MATLTEHQQSTLDALRKYDCQIKREEFEGRRGIPFAHYDAVSSDPRGYFTIKAATVKALFVAGHLVWDAQTSRYVLAVQP